jgi:AraC-like DNA-binding protein
MPFWQKEGVLFHTSFITSKVIDQHRDQIMRYQKFPPTAELLPFVECYFIWEGEAKESLDVQSPPNGFNAIVFNYGDPYEAYQNSKIKVAVPKAFVCGPFTTNYHLVLKGTIGMTGIVFKASALHNFFGIRMSQLVNSRMALELLLPDVGDSIWKNIKTSIGDGDRIKILEEFIISRLAGAKNRLSIIDEAVELIDHHKGSITVESVAAELKISRRYLEKKFLEKVGVSPKFYARIKRFVALSKKVVYSEKLNWQDIVFDSGLTDQSHLVKEFMEFNQMNPTDYYIKHNELIRYVKR